MRIFIDGINVFLKKGTSFQYVVENRLFTGSNNYTMSITFPMKDCWENENAFFFINRMDGNKSKMTYNCEIIDINFAKSGTLVVTHINEKEIKGQFLEGRAEQNYNASFDKIYINEMQLGYAPNVTKGAVNVTTAWNWYPYVNWVAIPWVNNSSGLLHNATVLNNGNPVWEDSSDLTFQPYLIYILKKICSNLGYTGDFHEIENSKYKYLLILNTLPPAWKVYNFGAVLPHWSLSQFFEEIENLLEGEFIINHKAKLITFSFTQPLLSRLSEVEIETVIDSYSIEVSMEEQSKYLGRKNVKFAEGDNPKWAYESCQWFINENASSALVFNTFAELQNWAGGYLTSGYERTVNNRGGVVERYWSGGYDSRTQSQGNKLLYCKEIDTYFVMYNYMSTFLKTVDHSSVFGTGGTTNFYLHYYKLKPVNRFGERFADRDAEELELKIIPAWIDETDSAHGPCVFLECGEMGSAEVNIDSDGNVTSTSSGTSIGGGRRSSGMSRAYVSSDSEDDESIAHSTAAKAIMRGENKKSDAYFDVIYVGFWDGSQRRWDGLLPRPTTDYIDIEGVSSLRRNSLSLRLNRTGNASAPADYLHKIDGKKKFTFSFFANDIPNPMAVFCIKGKRYLCEKITATFTENGRSQLLKGTFYLIDE
ncbi:MAG: hypothetical protein KBT34_05030 [Prevotella sp.]|nr:hypothetical protein [Candidatus Prevotella equi]